MSEKFDLSVTSKYLKALQISYKKVGGNITSLNNDELIGLHDFSNFQHLLFYCGRVKHRNLSF